jgi:RNA polymerase sigma factor (sigma-70 family)
MAIPKRSTAFRQIDRLFRDGTLVGLGDRQLLDRYVTRRDDRAFEALVELHGPMVLGVCRRILRDPRDIEDAFQATFLVFVRKASAIRDRDLLSNWLYGVAYRVASRARADTMRRRGREIAVANLEISVDADHQGFLDIGPALDQELNRLPGKYRAPLVLCYLRGQTHDQAAEALSCPVGTVRSRLARGRDLLKRRLTRRGYAPTAALLGPGSALPANLLTGSVPPTLLSATVDAAVGAYAFKTIHVGAAAASTIVLTQGVLTSMKLAQLKWIGLAMLTAGLSAGGAIVVATASAQNSKRNLQSAVAAAKLDPSVDSVLSTQDPLSTDPPPQSTEARLRLLEERIDLLFKLTGPAATRPMPNVDPNLPTLDRLEAKFRYFERLHNPEEHTKSAMPSRKRSSAAAEAKMPLRDTPVLPRTDVSGPEPDNRARPGDSSREIRELEGRLKLASAEYLNTEQLFRQHVVSPAERNLSHGKVELMLGALRGIDDDLAEQIDQCTLEIKRKKAEVDRAFAQAEAAQTVVERNTRLNDRKPGIVSTEDTAKAEAEHHAGAANAQVKVIELEESTLRRRQLERRRERVAQILKWAEQAVASGETSTTTTSPAR